MNEPEQVIVDSLLPNLIGNGVDKRKYQEVFSLPVRDCGLNIMLPRDCDEEFQRSKAVSVCLENPDPFDCELSQQHAESIQKGHIRKLLKKHLFA